MRIPGTGLLKMAAQPAAGALETLVRPVLADSRRRVRTFEDRAHVAMRGLRGAPGTRMAREVEDALEELPSVRWAVVNGVLEHVVVATEGPPDDEATLKAVLDVVEAVEEAHEATEGPLPPHPASGEPTGRAAWALATQAAALPVSLAGRAVSMLPLPVEAASLVTIVDTQPRLRGLVESALGKRNADTLLAGLNAAAQASSGGLFGLAVDTVRHGVRTAELNAYRAAWTEAESTLAATAQRATAACEDAPPRTAPLRDGRVERYAAKSALVAGVAFAGALAVTRRTGSAASAALAAIPKAPMLAREGFAATLGGTLAHRGAIVHTPEALRRLDRIDCVVLDTEVLTTGSHALSDLVPLDEDAPAGRLAATAHSLFDPEHPERYNEKDGWILGPLDRLSLRGRTGARARARLESAGAPRILGLAEGHRLQALIRTDPQVHEAADALTGAARSAGVRILVTAGDGPGRDSAPPGSDGTVPGGPVLAEAVRELQADGSGVLLVSRNRRALAAADLGVGVTGTDQDPAWGADVQVGPPWEAVVLVEACAVARTASRHGVRLAQAAAGLGAAITLTGRSRRPAAGSMAVVNSAAVLALASGAWSAAELLRHPPTPSVVQHPWHTMTPDTVLRRTGSSEQGLTRQQASSRLAARPDDHAGPPSLLRSVAAELANPLTPVLFGGAVLSAAVGGVLDAGIVVAVTGLSGLIGGVQRHGAERAVRELQERSVLRARVLRDGEERTVPAGELVPGDVVMLTGGDVVPADCRLLEARGTETDESSLTGESLPVAKSTEPVLVPDIADRTSMVYEGTTLAAGQARAVVVATGENTEAGRGTRAIRDAAPRAGVEHRIGRLTRTTLPLALGSAGAVMAAGLLRGRPAAETIGAGVGLAVASVPEGLPFLVSAAQLAAAQRLSAQGVLVRDPRTVEALGRTDVLCFDKTGTLTHGRVELTAVRADGHTRELNAMEARQRAVLAAALRATPRQRGGRKLEHFTDRAVTSGAEQAGVERTECAPGWRHTTSLPFEPSRGFHATRGRQGGVRLLSVKGAPEEVVERCATRGGRRLARADRDRILQESEQLATAGHRVLAVAERSGAAGGRLTDDAVCDLDFLGFLAFTDRVRSTAGSSVRQLEEAGVHIVMITGDHPQTAEAIARELEVLDGRRVVTGAELDGLDDGELAALLPRVGVVARSTPAHKVRVVRAFQRIGRTVAMTGDGANDAPAIRLAEVGIALGRHGGAPAARAAADLVVTDGRLETILAALVEGRAMWGSVRQALAVLVGGNFGEIAFTVLSASITGSSPLTARQLLLVNLFTDLAPAVALALRPPRRQAAERLLHEGPEASLGTALTDEIAVRAMATALSAAVAWLAARGTGRAARARTVALGALVGAQLGQTLLVGGRSPAVFVSSVGAMAGLVAVVQTPGVSHFFGCTPLGPVGWSIALGSATAATAGSLLLPPVARGGRTALASAARAWSARRESSLRGGQSPGDLGGPPPAGGLPAARTGGGRPVQAHAGAEPGR